MYQILRRWQIVNDDRVFSKIVTIERFLNFVDDVVIVDPPSEVPVQDTESSIVPCVNGRAGIYPCSGYDLQARISLSTMNATLGNDCWGWTDQQTGKEYAIMGLNNGTAFVDISTPDQPVYVGKLPTATVTNTWRDIKVFQDHAFIVSEASNHGLQVFDLTRLRNRTEFENLTADVQFNAFETA